MRVKYKMSDMVSEKENIGGVIFRLFGFVIFFVVAIMHGESCIAISFIGEGFYNGTCTNTHQ